MFDDDDRLDAQLTDDAVNARVAWLAPNRLSARRFTAAKYACAELRAFQSELAPLEVVLMATRLHELRVDMAARAARDAQAATSYFAGSLPRLAPASA